MTAAMHHLAAVAGLVAVAIIAIAVIVAWPSNSPAVGNCEQFRGAHGGGWVCVHPGGR